MSVTPPATTRWWPPNRKVRKGAAAFLTAEAAAVIGELTTGTPGWIAVLVGAITGSAALVTAYMASDE